MNDTGKISDGYHTFDELYLHRHLLFINLCKVLPPDVVVWKSVLHSDGSSYDGWFVLGINKERGEQITYHLPMEFWDKTEFAKNLNKAPEYDGHTSNDVLERLNKLLK